MVTFGRAYSSAEITETARALADKYSENLTYRIAGTSLCGREIPCLVLGSSPKCLLVSGGIHGRESINPVVLLRMVQDYAALFTDMTGEPQTEERKALLEHFSICFLPLMNPDGYEIALSGFQTVQEPMSRHVLQMRRIPHEEWKENARGVDINRNFPCRSFLAREHMPEAASEPETQTLIHMFEEYPDSVGYLDFHSRGQIIYYYRRAMPYSYNKKAKRIAKKLQKCSGYALGSRWEERGSRLDGGNSVNYYSEVYRRPAITIETAADEAGFPLDVKYQVHTYGEVKWIPMEYLRSFWLNL